MNKNNESKTKAKRKYNEKSYKRVSLYIKNEEMDIIEEFCKNNNYSKNNLFIEGVKEKIERDTGKSFDEFLKEHQQEQEPEEPKDTKEPKNPERPEVFKLDQ